jgi:hypothetical protein
MGCVDPQIRADYQLSTIGNQGMEADLWRNFISSFLSRQLKLIAALAERTDAYRHAQRPT